MDAAELFKSGDLNEAIRAQQDVVRSKPADAGARTFLFELLAFAGDLDRAKKQLTAVGAQDIERDAAAQTYHNLLHAEQQRREILETAGKTPSTFLDWPDELAPQWEALAYLQQGDGAAAAGCLAATAEVGNALRGHAGGDNFTGIRDADDLLSPVLEVFLGPDYYWLPWSQLQQLEVIPPETPRDLLWPACQIMLADGTLRRGYLPALYPNSHSHVDDKIRLGLMTDWLEDGDEPVRGIGRKIFLVGDADVTLIDLRMLSIAPNTTPSDS